MKTPGIKSYYAALQAQFKLQTGVLTDVLPHSGERGRNDEERFKEFLSRVLPRKFSVGSGFIICSDPSVSPSSQTDVVLFDEFHNSPIHRELASHVYPVEIVYGAIEVKGLLEKKDLSKICKDIRKVRKLGEYRHYLTYGAVPKSPELPDALVVANQEVQTNVPPRAFVFAYEKKGWKSIDKLVECLSEAVAEHGAHIHGLAVLGADWFISQEAYATDGPKFQFSEGDALLKFMNSMLHSIGSVHMLQMSIDRYYEKST